MTDDEDEGEDAIDSVDEFYEGDDQWYEIDDYVEGEDEGDGEDAADAGA